jgi:hypothetical protein
MIESLTFCPGQPGPQYSCFMIPTITGMTGMHHCMGSCKFLSLNSDPPDLSLPSN